MSIKLLKKLFKKQTLANVDHIEVKSITIKDIPVMLEIYEIFEPYFKELKYYELLNEKTETVIIFIHLCTGLTAEAISNLGATKLLPLFDRCLEVNLDFFTQTYSLKKNKDSVQQKQSIPEKRLPSKRLQGRIVQTYKDL